MSNIETNIELFASIKRDEIRDTIEGLATKAQANISDELRVKYVEVVNHPTFWPNFVGAQAELLAGE